MIGQFRFGTPFETGAVISEVPAGTDLFFRVKKTENGLRFTRPLAADERVLGLGESMGGMDKRGGTYIGYNTDNGYRPEPPSLYGSHNFFVTEGDEPIGAFFDTPQKVVFAIDDHGSGEIVVETPPDLVLYLISGEKTAYDTVKVFLSLIGRSFLPPLWAFGYGQSRWGYRCERDLQEVVDGYERAGIPLDYLCMDIDYMDRYVDFTVDKSRFPDLKGLSDRLKEKGIRLVPILDAGMKAKRGEPSYDEGIAHGYFCTNLKGKPFRAAVWPGMCHFPDFFRPEVREWFGQKYRVLTDCGIEGFWNDMNEPAIFYSEYTGKRNLFRLLFSFLFRKESAEEMAKGAYGDYHRFFHLIDGERVVHDRVHNLYGALMTRASSEQLERLIDGRFLLFSRSSYIGAHRYGGIWTGDNSSTWEHLRLNVLMMPALNMCGFLFSGADTGGFVGDCDRELLLRWHAVSAFTPLMRNHTIARSAPQECYAHSDPQDFKAIISFRYRFLPYLYSEFMKAALGGDMLLKPLSFGYPNDARARKIEDQLLVGESVMMAPVLEQGKSGRRVYLPEEMTMIRFDGERFLASEIEAGEREIEVPLNQIVFFVRKGKIVPLARHASNTKSLDLADVELFGDGTSYEQYRDDGKTRNFPKPVLLKR